MSRGVTALGLRGSRRGAEEICNGIPMVGHKMDSLIVPIKTKCRKSAKLNWLRCGWSTEYTKFTKDQIWQE